jgi:hypothetical protein
MLRRRLLWVAFCGFVAALADVSLGQERSAHFEQILAGGGIPAIDHPQYVDANKAEIDENNPETQLITPQTAGENRSTTR